MNDASAGRLPSRGARLWPLWLIAAVAACGGTDPSLSSPPSAAGSGGTTGTAGAAGAVQGGAGGDAAAGAAGAAAGAAGSAATPDALDDEACAARAKTAAALVAATDATGAAMASFSPDAGPVLVTLPAGGSGFVSFKLTTPHHDLALFVSSPAAFVSLSYAGAPLATPAPAPNPGCPAEVGGSVRVHVHAPGTYTVELAPSATPVWLLVVGG